MNAEDRAWETADGWKKKAEAAEARAKDGKRAALLLNEKLENAKEEVRQEEARAEALENIFTLQQTRMGEATEAWRKATGKHEVLPDLGDLLAWLLLERKALETENRRLRAKLKEYEDFTAPIRRAYEPGSNTVQQVALTPPEAQGREEKK